MRPDAIILPETIKDGDNFRERVQSITRLADPLLKVDRQAGEVSYIRKQHGDVLFITRDPEDTLYFAKEHPRYGQPRYRWEDKGRGVMFGYLIDQEPPKAPAADLDIARFVEQLANDP